MKNRTDAIGWLVFAEADLQVATTAKVSKKLKYAFLMFHLQQCVEKTLKAVLVFFAIDFSKTHDLEYLFSLMNKNKIAIPVKVKEAQYLGQYAVITRYPGDDIEVSKKEFTDAVKTSKTVLKWAKTIIQKKSDKLF
jgi:HEPN domain-containing protein